MKVIDHIFALTLVYGIGLLAGYVIHEMNGHPLFLVLYAFFFLLFGLLMMKNHLDHRIELKRR